MPSLVMKMQEGRRGGIWTVRWVYLPYFLAANQTLVKFVDEKLNAEFKRTAVMAGGDPGTERMMSRVIVDAILEFHSNRGWTIRGLKEVLEAVMAMEPSKTAALVPVVDNESVTPSPTSKPLSLMGNEDSSPTSMSEPADPSKTSETPPSSGPPGEAA